MSITSPIPGRGGVVITAVGRACTYCERATTDPAVTWSGPDGILVVHAECVGPWFLRLATDAHEIANPGYYSKRFGRRP